MITVLTPTYNRVLLLDVLYKSLTEQYFPDFEWVVIDDGSTDSTSALFEKLMQEKKIRINYIRKRNGGKHTAINRGVKEAKGDIILIVDSDDSLPCDSLYSINKQYLKIKDDESIAGVCGLMAHHDGTIIGDRNISSSMNLSSVEMRYEYGLVGDVCEVFKTDVLREFPFPEIENEKFCPEALVWNRIARKYKLRFFDNVIYYRDYLEGGLTSKIVRIRMNSPIASMMCYAELNQLDIPFKEKLKSAVNYWRFRMCYNGSNNYPKLDGLWDVVAPFGWLIHLNDVRINKR